MNPKQQLTLTIDGKNCVGEAGQTILEVAHANGIAIPTLCYMKQLSSWGGCRVCLVEIEGSPKAVPSCTTPASPASKVTTNSPRLQHLRRLTLELLFSERNHICPICPSSKGDCGLQHLGCQFGVDSVRYPYLFPKLEMDLSGKYFGLDHNRCILCTRCIRACDELEGVHTLDVGHRGIRNQIIVDLNITFGASTTCTQCGACVSACPTGALFDKGSAFRGPLRQCATVATTCTECPVGCGLSVYTMDNRIVDVFGDSESPVNHGHLCVRGRYQTWAEPRRRILQPLVRRGNGLVPVSWEQALQVVKAGINEASNWQKALLLSPRVTNETIGLLQKIGAEFDRIGTFVAKQEAALCCTPEFSAGSLERLEQADAIIVFGTQPSRDHGVIAAKIRTAVRKRGAKLILLHTNRSDLDVYADVAAHVVSLERKLWNRIGETLAQVKHPVLIYGPAALSPVGITIMDRLLKALEGKNGGGEMLAPIQMPASTNSLALATAGVEAVEDVSSWLGVQPLHFLQIVASDEPDGARRLIREKHVRSLLEQIDCLVVQASYESPLTEIAKVVLPSAIWAEKNGTVTNFEGRVLPLRAALRPLGEARQDNAILETIFS